MLEHFVSVAFGYDAEYIIHLPFPILDWYRFTCVRLNCNSSPHHMTLIKDHSTACKGVKINLHSSTSLIKIGVKSISLKKIPTLFWSFFISPDKDLLFEVETS